MTYTEKRLADFDKKFPSHGYNDNAENEFHSQNIKRFLTKSIAQAVAEERARVVGVIEKRMIGQNVIFNLVSRGELGETQKCNHANHILHDLRASLDKPLTDKE